uniref:Uncharacterized protein n=1 Tax=Chromera velia CCMP2878 TaxID=1169474 RepID=A0A0G4H4K9_9ALVE|eukprot:Cvel_842.t1-p1 / transcript=Cvel_842.t1 / gene=Cvel_842 / organism=Chromera_velia_CCMP2878 / gene_product=hypothetical protein / transcript_product=hypothetical protein / location=Cvel_scaffold26:76741-80908(-) / protein_length=655 / sequence_SO=supercontig / SO=protein_coding / is_pseudo=false
MSYTPLQNNRSEQRMLRGRTEGVLHGGRVAVEGPDRRSRSYTHLGSTPNHSYTAPLAAARGLISPDSQKRQEVELTMTAERALTRDVVLPAREGGNTDRGALREREADREKDFEERLQAHTAMLLHNLSHEMDSAVEDLGLPFALSQKVLHDIEAAMASTTAKAQKLRAAMRRQSQVHKERLAQAAALSEERVEATRKAMEKEFADKLNQERLRIRTDVEDALLERQAKLERALVGGGGRNTRQQAHQYPASRAATRDTNHVTVTRRGSPQGLRRSPQDLSLSPLQRQRHRPPYLHSPGLARGDDTSRSLGTSPVEHPMRLSLSPPQKNRRRKQAHTSTSPHTMSFSPPPRNRDGAAAEGNILHRCKTTRPPSFGVNSPSQSPAALRRGPGAHCEPCERECRGPTDSPPPTARELAERRTRQRQEHREALRAERLAAARYKKANPHGLKLGDSPAGTERRGRSSSPPSKVRPTIRRGVLEGRGGGGGGGRHGRGSGLGSPHVTTPPRLDRRRAEKEGDAQARVRRFSAPPVGSSPETPSVSVGQIERRGDGDGQVKAHLGTRRDSTRFLSSPLPPPKKGALVAVPSKRGGKGGASEDNRGAQMKGPQPSLQKKNGRAASDTHVRCGRGLFETLDRQMNRGPSDEKEARESVRFHN